MELLYLINEIKEQLDDINSFKAYIIKENSSKPGDYLELPIEDVKLDEDGEEINIFIRDEADSTQNRHETLNVGQLLDKLETFMSNGGHFHIFASHPTIYLDDDYCIRLDVPIVAHGINEENGTFGLLEQGKISSRLD